MNSFVKVSGERDEHDVKAFTISTCPWCKKTKKLLKDMDVEYRYADIDLLSGDEKEEVKEELSEYNPVRNVPTLVIDGGEEVIKGFKEEKIREVLED
ncbi:MAG: glutaredoxin family protein [Candidatus Aenigmatarchaeota archaeon]